ncbi:hypothetical protein FOZ62_018161, partial [Perkinsus olseni]
VQRWLLVESIMMILAYLTLLLTQATEGVFNVPFPQGRYIGGISHPHLRIVTIFVTLDEVQKVNLSVTCGYSSVSWSGCFDVVPKHGASDSFELEGYRTPRSVFFPEYMDLLDFFDSNCDRAPTLIGDLAVYSK